MERSNSDSDLDTEVAVDITSLRKEVDFVRRKQGFIKDESSLSECDSSSDFEFRENDFNSSDSEWSAGEEKQLRKKRAQDSCSSDDDLPLNLLKVRDRKKELPKSTSRSTGAPTSSEGTSTTPIVSSNGFSGLDRSDEDAETRHDEGGQSRIDVENDCWQVIMQMLDVIESDECGSVRNDMNEVDVNESGPARVLMDVSVSVREDISIPSTSKGGITISQAQVEDDMEVCNEQQLLGNEEQRSQSFTSVVASESGSLCSTPVPVERGRKRKRQPQNWERNKKKQALNAGEEFKSKDGKVTKRRSMKPGCGEKCAKKCHDNISNEQRERLFHQFWRLPTIVEKRTFINKYVYRKEKKSQTTNQSRRKKTIFWGFPSSQETGSYKTVCKTFFLHTLDISEQMISTALDKHDEDPIVQADNRGGNRVHTEDEKIHIRQHIESFPVVDSHYCRKNTKRQYLGGHLNISLMHRLYQEWRQENNKTPVSLRTYSDVFCTEYNLGFHRPSKDLCDMCTQYNNMAAEERLDIQDDYDTHLSDHRKVTELKQNCKDRCTADGFSTFIFDLEEVLLTPKLNASIWYYKRKLFTYNLSWYELGTTNACCNVWHEGLAGRGSNEISSCVYGALQDAAARNIKTVVLFSDSAGGQNKNRNFVTMLWVAVNKLSIETIEHVFFVRGHSKNENDSVHAAIERASKAVDVHTTAQWAAIMRTAKHKQPHYNVNEMDTSDFFDFKKLAATLANFDLDMESNKIRWLDIKRIKVLKSNPKSFFYSYSVTGEYKEVNLTKRIRKKTEIDPASVVLDVVNGGKKVGIDKDKKSDLMELCAKKLVPAIHHPFFQTLETNN